MSFRKWRTVCGGHLFAEHPTLKLIDVFAARNSRFEIRACGARQLSADPAASSAATDARYYLNFQRAIQSEQ
jgi:hypothetical protein